MRGATLGDAIKDRVVPCSTAGCARTWVWKGTDQLKSWLLPGGREPPPGFCEVCQEARVDFSDQAVPCSRSGCDGTWTWTKAERQAAWKRKQNDPPEKMCAACLERRGTVADVEVGYRIKGCPRTFTWPRAKQVDLGAPFVEPKAPEGMCEAHAKQVKQASDRKVPCRTPGCTRTWLWSRWQQMEAGSKEEDATKLDPPQRYCESCFAKFREANDQELPCRVKGCKNKFTWSKVAQVKAWHEAGEKEVSAPERMCNRCSELISKLEDKEVGCRIRSCKGTWKLTRGAQLESAVKGKKSPRRLCGTCASDLAKLQDREEPCKNAGCTRTWTWSRTAQLIAQRRHGDGTPPLPKRTCEGCERFVKEHQPTEVPCIGCATPIHWTSLSQLMVSLGKWVKPSRCPSCVSKGVPAPVEQVPVVEAESDASQPEPGNSIEDIGNKQNSPMETVD